jgi:hypothetical protein
MTSIEWLADQLKFTHKEAYNDLYEVIEQAKEMHKEELFEYWQGGINCTEVGDKSFDKYHKETLKDYHIVDINEMVELPKQDVLKAGEIGEISDEEIKKSMFRYNITDFGQMAAYITGAQWYKEQLKQSNCQEILDSSKKRAANYMNLKRK